MSSIVGKYSLGIFFLAVVKYSYGFPKVYGITYKNSGEHPRAVQIKKPPNVMSLWLVSSLEVNTCVRKRG